MSMNDSSRASISRAPRPMLSRDADSVYWMSRYVERAEHIARILLVNTNMLIDVGDFAPSMQDRQWEGVLSITRSTALPLPPDNGDAAGESPRAGQIAQHMTFN